MGNSVVLLSIEWNSMRLGGSNCGIVTKTVHKILHGWWDKLVWGGYGLEWNLVGGKSLELM